MSAIFLDGFDHYGTGAISTTAMLAGTYASGSNNSYCTTPSWGPARTGQYCLIMSGNEQSPLRKVLPAANTHLFVSFGFAVDTLFDHNANLGTGDTGYNIIAFTDSNNSQICKLGLTTTGAINLLDKNNVILATTNGPVIKSENWHFMEMEFNVGAGTFALRVDDAQAVNAPLINYSGSFIGPVSSIQLLPCFTGTSVMVNCYMDDLFVRDSTGTYNNGWQGDRRIATLFANSDTTAKNWTPSYYHEFGAGICSLSTKIAGNNNPQGTDSMLGLANATALDIGNADFTLETFVRFDALPTNGNYSAIWSRWDTYNNHRSYRLILGSQSFNNSCIQFDTSVNGTTSTTKLAYPWTPTINTWYHVALVRAAGELLLFINGQQMGLPIADTDTYYSGGVEWLYLGNEYQNSSPGFNGAYVANTFLCGRLDETRFTNGYARYTAPFAMPTAAFPRGVADPNWSQVVLLMGYDSNIVDESSYNRAVQIGGHAVSLIPPDGAAIGVYTTVNKASPDDNTFISANLTNASNILTMTTQPANGDTITVGTKDGTVAAVYTFKTAITSAFDVLIDTTAQNTLMNFLNAINAGTGAGTKFGTGTTSNFDVNAIQLPVGQIQVLANLAGTGGNSIASTSTGTAAHWTTSTLTGGSNIPGPTNFKFQRPPNNTTIISAMQTNVRALKTDAGTANVQTALIGPLGGTRSGAIHPLTVAANYYSDVIETDPDSGGSLSPTTIINGQFQINRTS